MIFFLQQKLTILSAKSKLKHIINFIFAYFYTVNLKTNMYTNMRCTSINTHSFCEKTKLTMFKFNLTRNCVKALNAALK